MRLILLEDNGYIPLPANLHEINGWCPASSAQMTFINCRAQMALFGGQSGGGKSNVLVADSAQEYSNPNFRGILLRKSFSEMTNIVDEMAKIYSPLGGRRAEGGKLWRFPSGAQMRLGYLAKDTDVDLYTGKPISWLGIDEAQFQTENRIRALLPWVATPPEWGLRDRVRMTANPSTPWLLHLFLNDFCPIHFAAKSTRPCAVYAGATWKKDGEPVMLTTCFIPAKLADNPHYDERKQAMLMSQTEAIRKKLLEGCWCQIEGAFFPFLDESYMVPYSDCGEQWWHTHFISMDFGFSSSSAATGLYFMHENGRIFKIQEIVEKKMYSEEYAHEVMRKMLRRELDGKRIRLQVGYADPAMDAHTGTGKSNLDIINGVFEAEQFTLVKASKSRIANAQLLAGKLRRGEYCLTDMVPQTFESLTTRKNDPDEPGAILKVAGDPLDDICLAAGTLVETASGKLPIEAIGSGDQVLTRRGLRRVLWAGITSASAKTITVEFSNGTHLRGTPNHPVFVHGKGFIRLDSLRYGDKIESCSELEWWRKLPIKGSSLDAIRNLKTGAIEITLRQVPPIDFRASRICIAKSIKTILDRFQRATSSIMRTITPPTTIREISSYSLVPPMLPIMDASAWPMQSISPEREPTAIQSERPLPIGIGLLKAEPGIARTPKSRETTFHPSARSSVSNAVKRFLAILSGSAFTARQSVQQNGGGDLDSTMSKESVDAAVSNSSSIAMRVSDSAPVSVLRVTTGKKEKVYNLSVEDEQEYFANGILVHNCDTDLYGLNNFVTGEVKPNEIAVGEKIEELRQKGVDERSIAVVKFRLEKELEKQSAPASIARPTLRNLVIRR